MVLPYIPSNCLLNRLSYLGLLVHRDGERSPLIVRGRKMSHIVSPKKSKNVLGTYAMGGGWVKPS